MPDNTEKIPAAKLSAPPLKTATSCHNTSKSAKQGNDYKFELKDVFSGFSGLGEVDSVEISFAGVGEQIHSGANK